MVAHYFLWPKKAYDINIKIEEHPFDTYSKYLIKYPNDQRIHYWAADELIHTKELKDSLALTCNTFL